MADTLRIQCAGSDVPECHFWKLPQELQDMIFDLAYAYESAYKLTNKKAFKEKQDRKERTTRDRVPFPTLKVQDFMVCKAWFVGAAKSWIGAQRIKQPKHYAGLNWFKNGLFASYARYIESEADPDDLEVFKSYRSLRVLKLQVNETDFYFHNNEYGQDKCLRLERLTREDFAKQSVAQELIKLRLDDFKLSKASLNECWSRSSEQRKIWKANLKAFKAYVDSFVLQDKDDSYTPKRTIVSSGPMPLYLGSRVCFATSSLLPSDYYDTYTAFAINHKYTTAQRSTTIT